MADHIRTLIVVATLGIMLAGIFSAGPGWVKQTDSPAWDFESLERKAQTCAEHPFQVSPPLPAQLRTLDYDSYRLIAFEPAAGIWKNDPFAIECFHRGYIFTDKVGINLVEDGRPRVLPFDRKMFQYRGRLSDLAVPDDLGFAGFRVLGRFTSEKNKLEIASFLGASYFRAIAQGQVYGTSARGLAIDVGMPKAEEFPVFREFWIERPAPSPRPLPRGECPWAPGRGEGAGPLRIWALLDSPSVAGAYRLDLQPRSDTVVAVKARLFFRRQPDKIGLAPLTSMWMWGDGVERPANETRPKVHDSDGLLVCTKDNEWVWRPLSRQKYPSLSHFDYSGIRGFGLMQRDRRPSSFHDDEAKYHQRPSVWIEPKKGWADGAVELLELPAHHEGIDNIAAWWKPNQAVTVGRPLDLEYSVMFKSGEPEHAVGRATGLRVIRRPGHPIGIEIEFLGEGLAAIPADEKLTCDVDAQRGHVSNVLCRKLGDSRGQISFDIRPDGSEPVELTAKLKNDGKILTETWRYLCSN